jgi:uncharacterized protein YceK
MKRYLLLASAVALLALSGCGTQTTTTDTSDQTAATTSGADATLLSGTNPIMCKQAISDYLAKADLK